MKLRAPTYDNGDKTQFIDLAQTSKPLQLLRNKIFMEYTSLRKQRRGSDVT